MNLNGKVALVTGAGTGIGTAIAERFVADGARVCLTGRRREMLDQVAHGLPAGTTSTCAGDITKSEDVLRMVEAAVRFGGRLDVLVSNAALDRGGLIEAMIQTEAIRRAMLEKPLDQLKPVDVLETGFFKLKNFDMGGLTATPITYGPSKVEGVDQVRVDQIQKGKIVNLGTYPARHIFKHE